jgi:hypothetical protein
MATHVNIIRLRGEVARINGDQLTMICRPANPREIGAHYENIIPMDISGIPKNRLKGLVGKRIECAGQIINLPTEPDEPNASTFRPFKEVFAVTEEPGDLNQAEVVGDVPSGVIFRPRKGMSRAFSNVLMLCGGTYIWSIFFRTYAQEIKEKCPRGSLLKVVGRLNWREYEDEHTGWREAYEIIADGELSEVLKKAEVVDELADLRELGSVDVPDADEVPADGAESAEGTI